MKYQITKTETIVHVQWIDVPDDWDEDRICKVAEEVLGDQWIDEENDLDYYLDKLENEADEECIALEYLAVVSDS